MQTKVVTGWIVVMLVAAGVALATYACSTNGAAASRPDGSAQTLEPLLGRAAGQSQFLSLVERHATPAAASTRPLFKTGASGSQRLYAASYERGLSVLDTSGDIPRLRGRVAASGHRPRTMYVDAVHERVLVLEDAYYDGRTDVHNWTDVQSRLVAYDVSRPDDPRVATIVDMKGAVAQSRLVGDVLYVATTVRPASTAPAATRNDVGTTAYVHSFKLGDWVSRIEERELSAPVVRRLEAISRSEPGAERAYFVAVLAPDDKEWSPRPHRIEVVDVSDAEGHIQPLMQVTLQDPVRDGVRFAIDRDSFRVIRSDGERAVVESFGLPGRCAQRACSKVSSEDELPGLTPELLRGRFVRRTSERSHGTHAALVKLVPDEVYGETRPRREARPLPREAAQDTPVDSYAGLELMRDVRAYLTLSRGNAEHGVQIVQKASATELRLTPAAHADAELVATSQQLVLPGTFLDAAEHLGDRLVVLTQAETDLAASLIGLGPDGGLVVISRAVWPKEQRAAALVQLGSGRIVAASGTSLRELQIDQRSIHAEPIVLRDCKLPADARVELLAVRGKPLLRYAEPVADALDGAWRYERPFVSVLREKIGELVCTTPVNVPGRPIFLRGSSLVTEEASPRGAGRVLSSLSIDGNKAVLVDDYDARSVRTGGVQLAHGEQLVFIETDVASGDDAWPPSYETTTKRWTSLALDRARRFVKTAHELDEAAGAHPQIVGILQQKEGRALAVVTQGQGLQVFSFLGSARPVLTSLEKIGPAGEVLPPTERMKLDGPAWWDGQGTPLHYSPGSSTLELALSKFGVTQARVVD